MHDEMTDAQDAFEDMAAAAYSTHQDDDSPETVRRQLEQEHGQVWDTAELQRDFVVESFAAPLVIVTRKSDGERGSLCFTHNPRFYYSFR